LLQLQHEPASSLKIVGSDKRCRQRKMDYLARLHKSTFFCSFAKKLSGRFQIFTARPDDIGRRSQAHLCIDAPRDAPRLTLAIRRLRITSGTQAKKRMIQNDMRRQCSRTPPEAHSSKWSAG
jgi:murein L,D-transpeptidase YcbB/YkuD